MPKRKSFGETLRDLRIKADRSMGEVARAIGVSTVYYSDVENGRKKPFPLDKKYRKLANAVNGDRSKLMKLAALERGKVELTLDSANGETQRVALSLARRLNDESLTKEELAEIREILEGKRG